MLTQLGVVILGISFMQSPLVSINSTENNSLIESSAESTGQLSVYGALIQPTIPPTVFASAYPPPVFSPAAGPDTEVPAGHAVNHHMARPDTDDPVLGSAEKSGPGMTIGREFTQARLPSPTCKIPPALASEAAAGHRFVAARSARLARVRTMDCAHRADECGDSCQTDSSKPAVMTAPRPISG
jgi:hypothetical protein